MAEILERSSRDRRSGRARLWRPLPVAAALVWLTLVGSAAARLSIYDVTPGQEAQAPAEWPEAWGLAPRHARLTVLVFVHTRCPCSRSTLHELERILARGHGDVDARVVVIAPPGDVAEEEALRHHASRLPGALVVSDVGLAHRFGAATSGQVLAYDDRGHLAFAGGVTPARGHEGASVGGDTLLTLVEGRAQRVERSHEDRAARTAVFGCSLFGRRAEP